MKKVINPPMPLTIKKYWKAILNVVLLIKIIVTTFFLYIWQIYSVKSKFNYILDMKKLFKVLVILVIFVQISIFFFKFLNFQVFSLKQSNFDISRIQVFGNPEIRVDNFLLCGTNLKTTLYFFQFLQELRTMLNIVCLKSCI